MVWIEKQHRSTEDRAEIFAKVKFSRTSVTIGRLQEHSQTVDCWIYNPPVTSGKIASGNAATLIQRRWPMPCATFCKIKSSFPDKTAGEKLWPCAFACPMVIQNVGKSKPYLYMPSLLHLWSVILCIRNCHNLNSISYKKCPYIHEDSTFEDQ